MVNLANCYYKEIGTEKNLERAVFWYQEAAKNGIKEGMDMLANIYENGDGIEINLEKAFYWHQKVIENNNVVENCKVNESELICYDCKKSHIYYPWFEQCNECNQPYNDYHWCKQCNFKRFQQDFSKWTSKNEFIDKFIQEAQLSAKNSYEILEWIPYNKLLNISYYDKGGFGTIYKAIWSDGPIDNWNFDKQQWNRRNQSKYEEVILKTLNDSSNLNNKFLNEWKYHYNYDYYNELFIIDLGLCKSVSDSQDNAIYGNLPYMAPEILRKGPYTLASDIYSFSIIMWEFTSGTPPFNHKEYDDIELILNICEGERPKIIENTPQCYIDLMEKCWDPNPSYRPTIKELEYKISEWIRCINEHYKININITKDYECTKSNMDNKIKDELLEFINADNTLVKKQASVSNIQSHLQIDYTSYNFTKTSNNSLESYMIKD
ncbi:kinase-like domain-containing protein [Rhizophagus clarus]|uniref:Kinase-like domain-containing protein n=1 Tax=Rhizophagus clarus TaxID=94130 RepID=A0A8H3QNY8_9GLOM|nr:kinase-like domain-containing protein [Rhizophagus clarus]